LAPLRYIAWRPSRGLSQCPEDIAVLRRITRSCPHCPQPQQLFRMLSPGKDHGKDKPSPPPRQHNDDQSGGFTMHAGLLRILHRICWVYHPSCTRLRYAYFRALNPHSFEKQVVLRSLITLCKLIECGCTSPRHNTTELTSGCSLCHGSHPPDQLQPTSNSL
jgi:hypothetical protein